RFNSISVSSIKFCLLCALWYSSSAFSSNTGKVILNRFKYPVTLTIVQFGLVAIWSGLSSFSFLSTLGIRRPTKSMLRGTFIMSLFSIAGHVFSSMAMARIPVSTVHTIKALSPLFTVIAYAGLFGVRYGFLTYFSLLPLTLGVMLACSFDMRANGIGFLCALGSTIVFVSQNIFGKKLLPSSSSSSQKHKRTLSSSSAGNQIDKLNLLFYSSAMAFLLMIPIWIWVDSRALLFSSESIDLVPSSSEHNPTGLSVYFIINGTVHFAQCILAFTILSQTSPVTYSIASLIKRVVVIAMSIVWFNQKVSSLQFFGMILTFLGLYIYNRTKSEIDRGERKRERQVLGDSLILPTNEIEAKQLAAEK
ncbi:triose-phosphate transporter family-domain-containing protein, partial [Phakopsora pachyrhizi]